MEEAVTSEEALRREAEQARYTLRSSFYYRAQSIWDEYKRLSQPRTPSALVWDNRQDWGITDNAWKRVTSKRIQPYLVFCHPDLLQHSSRAVDYYRCLALLPLKGFGRVTRWEPGSGTRQMKIARVLNRLISLLIESDPDWSLDKLQTAALMNLGTQINGSWRNEIGAEGSRQVKELLLTGLQEAAQVKQVTLQDGAVTKPPISAIRIPAVQKITSTSDYTIVFSSEPDISIRDPKGALVATVEVKYGLDPAGALERYGAAKKSFEQATNENRRVVNIYLTACFTDEVRRRIENDRLVNQEFNLIGVLSDPEERRNFLTYVRRLLGL